MSIIPSIARRPGVYTQQMYFIHVISAILNLWSSAEKGDGAVQSRESRQLLPPPPNPLCAAPSVSTPSPECPSKPCCEVSARPSPSPSREEVTGPRSLPPFVAGLQKQEGWEAFRRGPEGTPPGPAIEATDSLVLRACHHPEALSPVLSSSLSSFKFPQTV